MGLESDSRRRDHGCRKTHTQGSTRDDAARRAEAHGRALLGEDAAEERHVGPQLGGQRVQAAEGAEVDHAVGGLGAVLHRDIPSWRERHATSIFTSTI